MAQSLLLVLLILTIILPRQAQSGLTALNTWMKQNDRTIEIFVSIIFGLLFLAIGLGQL